MGQTDTIVNFYLVDYKMTADTTLELLRMLLTHVIIDKRRCKPESPKAKAWRNYIHRFSNLSDTLEVSCPGSMI